MYEIKECITNKEQYGDINPKLEIMANKIEMSKQVRVEFTDIYGKEFDLGFDESVEETDEMLESKVYAGAENMKREKYIKYKVILQKGHNKTK